MGSERTNPEAIFRPLLPHSKAPSTAITTAKVGRISVFIRGGQALPVSKYIKMKLLRQEVEDVVLPLFHCSQPQTLSFHPNQVLTDPGDSIRSFFASKSLPE